jgi:hypothetical protein
MRNLSRFRVSAPPSRKAALAVDEAGASSRQRCSLYLFADGTLDWRRSRGAREPCVLGEPAFFTSSRPNTRPAADPRALCPRGHPDRRPAAATLARSIVNRLAAPDIEGMSEPELSDEETRTLIDYAPQIRRGTLAPVTRVAADHRNSTRNRSRCQNRESGSSGAAGWRGSGGLIRRFQPLDVPVEAIGKRE